MKPARFLVDMSASCESCGSRLALSMPTAAVDKHNAVAHAFVAHARIKTWLIDHAKTCAGAPAPDARETERVPVLFAAVPRVRT